MSASIAVVGGGVIGRTAAMELAETGHDVTVISAEPVEETTSAIAGGLWMPYHAEPAERVLAWGRTTRDWLLGLVDVAAPHGVRLVDTAIYSADEEPDLPFLEGLPGAWIEPAGADAPHGARSVARGRFPVVDMGRHLPWLVAKGLERGVAEVRRRIGSVEEAGEYGDVVVLATGLGTNELVADARVEPVRGQIVRLENPGGLRVLAWDAPDGSITYVIPRIDDVVVGGTAVAGAWDTTPDAAVEADILHRAAELEPRIAGLPVVGRAVGLRPGRDEVRLERVGDVIHCYGHGGSGVTIGYGCAREIVDLVG